MNQAKELQELRQKVFIVGQRQIVYHDCKSCQTADNVLSPVLSPVSTSTKSYFSVEEGIRGDNVQENETRKDSTNLSPPSDTFFPHPDDPGVTYRVESNHDTKVALKLNQVHTLTRNTSRTYAAFSPDGKYLATASQDGRVNIFDAKTGKRLR